MHTQTTPEVPCALTFYKLWRASVRNLLLVYGRQKRQGQKNSLLLKDALYVGEAVLPGFQLLDTGDGPLVRAGDGLVLVEVYLVTDGELLAIDGFVRRHSSLAQRIEVSFFFLKNENRQPSLKGFVYSATGHDAARTRTFAVIPSGKWDNAA